MNVLYLFHNYDSMMYKWQIYHIVNELKEHNVFIDIISPNNYNSVDDLNDEILIRMSDNTYDLFMTCLNEKFIKISTLKSINKKKLLFCPDNLVAPYNHKKICKYFDLVWLTSRETEYLFNKWKAKTIFLPYAANPNLLYPCEFESLERRVCFVGTPHGSRIRTINKLIDNGIKVTIYSTVTDKSTKLINAPLRKYFKELKRYLSYSIGWKILFGVLKDKFKKESLHVENKNLIIEKPINVNDLSKIYNKYYLVLAFSEANSTGYLKKPVDIVNLRNFEIPMSGCIELVRYTSEMNSYFEDGKEIVYYDDIEKDLNKIKDFLDNNSVEEVRKMKQAARLKSINNHTWYHRFKKIMDVLVIK